MATCELGYHNPHERDREDIRQEIRDAYEEEFYQEALEAFEKICKFHADDFAKMIAWCYLEDYSEAKRIFKTLGLNYRHAYVLNGDSREFWQDIEESSL